MVGRPVEDRAFCRPRGFCPVTDLDLISVRVSVGPRSPLDVSFQSGDQ